MTRIFIGIPTYRRPDLVQEAVASVIGQTYAEFRLVVSDNDSGTDAADRIAGYIAELREPRVTFHRQPRNLGEYGQGRFFFEQAQDADLMMILHDDDRLNPTYLEEAVAALMRHAEAAYFVANGYGIDGQGLRSDELTAKHLKHHGRHGATEGLFGVLDKHVTCGFAPISGTLFRAAALRQAGFVDADLHGNYPFECNVFLRLGEAGCRAWFCPRLLMETRYHSGSFRSQLPLEDPALVSTSIRLWARRRFSGSLERRRRRILSRFYRAQAMIEARQGRRDAARSSLALALRTNPASVRAWALAPRLLLAGARSREAGQERAG